MKRTLTKNIMSWAMALSLGLAIWAWPAQTMAQGRKPLPIEGKRTLYQRVIAHPGAKLLAQPQAGAAEAGGVRPFTPLYVYTRQGAGWLEVGPSSNGPTGWVEAAQTTEWRQALTLLFTDRTGRQPVLFFKSAQALEAAVSGPPDNIVRLASQAAALKASGAPPAPDMPVLAVEPTEEAVPRTRFYIMPIMQATEPFEGVKVLNVACIDPGQGPNQEQAAPAGNPSAGAQAGAAAVPMQQNVSDLRTGIAFVIDTTISMGPYIDRSRRAVMHIYDAVAQSNLSDRVAFALVAYRNSVAKSPGLGYVTKVISDFQDGTQRALFEAALAQVDEARVSSHSFNEDAMAGLKTAVDSLDWRPYQSKLIFLITDAGALRNDDPNSLSRMNEMELADMANGKGIKVFALHLKTPAGQAHGRNNHAYAEGQYRALTGHPDGDIGDLYVSIDANQTRLGVESYGQMVEAIAGQMVTLVDYTAAGRRLPPAQPRPQTPPANPVDEVQRKAAALGYAMQLDFLGQRSGVRAPEVVSSWVADKDLTRPQTDALQVAVLLTKTQLSDLQRQLKLIVDQALRTKRTGATDFFQSIVSAAAQMSRDPVNFSRNPGSNLQQLGVLGEFLEDLPYKSNILRLTEEDWYRMSVGQQTAFVDTLRSKIVRYEEYHNDVSNWESFGSSNPGDAVYRVPLSMLP